MNSFTRNTREAKLHVQGKDDKAPLLSTKPTIFAKKKVQIIAYVIGHLIFSLPFPTFLSFMFIVCLFCFYGNIIKLYLVENVYDGNIGE